ncbi:MAG: DNA-directed RNA polymerase subunit beta', partial [Dehalococcoides mccartyi]
SEIDGVVEVIENENGRHIRIASDEVYQDEYELPSGWKTQVQSRQWVDSGMVLASPELEGKSKAVVQSDQNVVARVAGEVTIEGNLITIKYSESEEREYTIPAAMQIKVKTGDTIRAGQQLTDGSINPQDILSILGRDAVQKYLVEEVQKVYYSQGVHINDKHIEVIARQMLIKVRIDSSGDTDLVPGELVDKFRYEDINAKVLAEGGEPATAHTVLMGITRASLSTESWLAAASFQETTRVLTDAAIYGRVDKLSGLKENVIIGKLIPAQCKSCKEATIERAERIAAAASAPAMSGLPENCL